MKKHFKKDKEIKTYLGTSIGISVVFTVVFLIISCIVTGLIIREINYKNNYIKTSGIVLNIEIESRGDSSTTHYLMMYSDGDGNTRQGWLQSNGMRDYGISQRIEFLMNPNNYSEIVMILPTFIFLLMIAMAAIFGIFGISMLISSTRPIRRRKLVGVGRPLNIEITYCGASNTRYNNRTSYIIKGEWSDGYGKTYRFKSPHLTAMPALKVGDEFEVFVDPNNYKKYYFDIKDKLPIYYENNENVTVN